MAKTVSVQSTHSHDNFDCRLLIAYQLIQLSAQSQQIWRQSCHGTLQCSMSGGKFNEGKGSCSSSISVQTIPREFIAKSATMEH